MEDYVSMAFLLIFYDNLFNTIILNLFNIIILNWFHIIILNFFLKVYYSVNFYCQHFVEKMLKIIVMVDYYYATVLVSE